MSDQDDSVLDSIKKVRLKSLYGALINYSNDHSMDKRLNIQRASFTLCVIFVVQCFFLIFAQ